MLEVLLVIVVFLAHTVLMYFYLAAVSLMVEGKGGLGLLCWWAGGSDGGVCGVRYFV